MWQGHICEQEVCGACVVGDPHHLKSIRATVTPKWHSSGCLLVKIELWQFCMQKALEVSYFNFCVMWRRNSKCTSSVCFFRWLPLTSRCFTSCDGGSWAQNKRGRFAQGEQTFPLLWKKQHGPVRQWPSCQLQLHFLLSLLQGQPLLLWKQDDLGFKQPLRLVQPG